MMRRAREVLQTRELHMCMLTWFFRVTQGTFVCFPFSGFHFLFSVFRLFRFPFSRSSGSSFSVFRFPGLPGLPFSVFRVFVFRFPFSVVWPSRVPFSVFRVPVVVLVVSVSRNW